MRNFRRRSYRHTRRRQQNVTWQRVAGTAAISIAPVNISLEKLFNFEPGVGAGSTFRQFDDQVVLERIRGSWNIAYDATGSGSVTGPSHFALYAFKVPAEVSQNLEELDLPDPYDSLEGDDYFLYQDYTLCWDNGSVNAYSNMLSGEAALIDSKAKRKFDVGDGILVCARFRNDTNLTAVHRISCSLSLLWKKRI